MNNYGTGDTHASNQYLASVDQPDYERMQSHARPNSRIPPNAVINTGPVTYSQGPIRGGTDSNHTPYAISSKDGRARYEAKSHAYRQQDYGARDTTAAPWQPSYAQHNSSYGHNGGGYSRTSAVAADELREALQRVSNHTDQPYYTTAIYQTESGHDTSGDTVV